VNIAKRETIETRTAPIFFDASKLSPTTEYVCWIDVMGSESIMLRSLKTASNFVMKLHIVALATCESIKVDVFPVIDGMYVCSPSQKPILDFIDNVYSTLADTFIHEKEPYKTFVIRGGLSYGPIVKGSQTLVCNAKLKSNPKYTERILIGPALTQAYRTEEKSPPFGLAVHESVRTFAPVKDNVLSMTFWKWWVSDKTDGEQKASEVYTGINEYFNWCLQHTIELSYPQEKIKKHKDLADEYFSEFIKHNS
jgi:hypothetical protein